MLSLRHVQAGSGTGANGALGRARAGLGRRAPSTGGRSARSAALGLAWSLAGCAEADVEQLKICERLIPAIEAEGAQIEVVRGTTDPAVANAVRIEYRLIGAQGASDGSWISCRFGGSGFARDRLRLTGVVTAREGALSEIAVFMLRRYWLDLYEAQGPLEDGAAEGGRSWSRDLLYFMQLGGQRAHARLPLRSARDRLHPGLRRPRQDQSRVRRDRDHRRVHHLHRGDRAGAARARAVAARAARRAGVGRRRRGGVRAGDRAAGVPAATRSAIPGAADRDPRPCDLSAGGAAPAAGRRRPVGAAGVLRRRIS